MAANTTLWQTGDGERNFVIPDGFVFAPGALHIHDRVGRDEHVDPQCIASFELSTEQAQRWSKHELGELLGELRQGIESRLSELREGLTDYNRGAATCENAAVVIDFLTSLPRVIVQSLSTDQTRLSKARHTMSRLQERLRESGFDVDDRVGNFADRIASIRSEAFSQSKTPENKD